MTLIAGCVSILAMIVSCRSTLPSPDGYYEDTKIATIGFTYWKFESGKVELVMEDGPLQYGTYTNINGDWVWIDRSGTRLLLRPSRNNLRIMDPDDKKELVYRSPLKRLRH